MAGAVKSVHLPLYSRIPIDRVVSGLLHVVVAHSPTEDDCVDEYYTNWGTATVKNIASEADGGGGTTQITTSAAHGLSTGNVVVISGTTNYDGVWNITVNGSSTFLINTAFVPNGEAIGTVTIEGAGSPPIDAQQTPPFNSAQTVDPGRTGYGLRLGDYDTFLFFVTAAVHLDTPTYGTLYSNPVGYDPGDLYVSITHPKCQSFVRSTLLARHNNAYGMAANFYKYGLDTVRWYGRTFDAVTTDSSNIVCNGVYSDENTYFETDLSVLTNNSYFTPVYDIKIEAKHQLELAEHTWSGPGGTDYGTLYTVVSHHTTFWNLLVNIKLYGFDKAGDDAAYVAFVRSRTNVFFQPFGETASLQFSATEFTS